MAKPTGPRPLVCYHCRHRFEAADQTVSTSCPKCAKRLDVADVIVKTAHSVTKLQTCGRVVVRRKATLIADLVEAHEGIEVQGELRAKRSTAPTIVIGSRAVWTGDLQTRVLKLELGAQVRNGFFEVPASPDCDPLESLAPDQTTITVVKKRKVPTRTI